MKDSAWLWIAVLGTALVVVGCSDSSVNGTGGSAGGGGEGGDQGLAPDPLAILLGPPDRLMRLLAGHMHDIKWNAGRIGDRHQLGSVPG